MTKAIRRTVLGMTAKRYAHNHKKNDKCLSQPPYHIHPSNIAF
jgi:hypothetical protein